MTNKSLEAFVKSAERLQGITACVMYSDLKLKRKRSCVKEEMRYQKQSTWSHFAKTLTPFLCDQHVKFNTRFFVNDELRVRHSTALTQRDKVSRLCPLASIIKAGVYLVVDSIKRDAASGLMVMRGIFGKPSECSGTEATASRTIYSAC
jgi:hypothetical protein